MISPETVGKIKARMALASVFEEDVEESFILGSGPGGQKVNKTQSGVLLRYRLGDELLVIKWTRERHHELNRFLALRELCDEVEVRVSPKTSARLADIERARKQKDRTRRRQLARAAADPADPAGPADPADSTDRSDRTDPTDPADENDDSAA